MTSLGPTRFTELVGCRLPLQQAGMGGVTTAALAAAVANEGALGMLAAAGRSADALTADLSDVARLTRDEGRVGVNFLMPFLDFAALEAAAARAPLVECFYGDPDTAVVERIHAGGALAAWQIGSPDEARAAADAGCDLVVAQGREAGGHVRGTIALEPLLASVLAAIDLPIVAAGGIGSGHDMARALRAGADGVRVGTRFVATDEADAHPDYVAALVAARSSDTVLSEAFSMGWPDAPHRVLRSCVDASTADPSVRSVPPPTRDFVGRVAEAALYAGESVGAVARVMPAADVVRELVAEALTS